MESEVKRLHNLIMEINDQKLKTQQDKLEKITREIDECCSAVTKAQVAIRTVNRCGAARGEASAAGCGIRNVQFRSHFQSVFFCYNSICLSLKCSISG